MGSEDVNFAGMIESVMNCGHMKEFDFHIPIPITIAQMVTDAHIRTVLAFFSSSME